MSVSKLVLTLPLLAAMSLQGQSRYTGPVMHIAGAMTAPEIVEQTTPEYTDQARRAKFKGSIRVYLWVDPDGLPLNVRVVLPVGLGMDEKAVEAVRHYKFKPATLNGKPVAVDLYVDVPCDASAD